MDQDQYYMNMAVAAGARANCLGRKVGAVIVVDNRVVSTGYNGTPSGFTNCTEGGCVRCKSNATPGANYDLCICVHAEQNALMTAAREGIRAKGATVFTTLEPCFVCLKESFQAGIERIVFLKTLNAYADDPDLMLQYRELSDLLPKGTEPLRWQAAEWPSLALGHPG